MNKVVKIWGRPCGLEMSVEMDKFIGREGVVKGVKNNGIETFVLVEIDGEEHYWAEHKVEEVKQTQGCSLASL